MKNKRILFVAPKFYQYHTEIINAMENKGAHVTYFPEMNHSLIYRISNKVSKRIEQYIKNKYIDNLLLSIEKNMYDIVFVIRGGTLSPYSLEFMKKKLPKAKFIMYQWDSMEQSQYQAIIKYFDVLKTFDKNDSIKYNIEYLPLFYTKKYKDIAINKKEKEYDLVFYGAYHSDRLEIVKRIDELFKNNKLIFKHHLFITKLALTRLLFTRKIKLSDLDFFKTYSVNVDEIIDVYAKANAVLDIELSIQNGLTMRTFETLGANLKLVTTNQNIKKEIFFNPEQIIVIDRNNIKIDIENLKQQAISNNFEEFYIDKWLMNLLS
jgi:hypothetical protein